jgi:glycosyltransferase involved in cell wall biosynthesis
MRVLHAISGLDPENGGPTFALVGLADAQVRAGMDVTVIATWQITSGFAQAERLRAAGVKVEMIGQAHGKLSRHPELAAAVDRAVAQSDVVHIHALWEEIQHRAARSAQRRGVPYIITPHGMLSPWSRAQGSVVNRWGKRLYLSARLRRNLDSAAAIHFTTSAERDLVMPLQFKAPPLVEPIGLDLKEFQDLPPRGAFRAHHAQIADRPMVLLLGRLSPQKGLERLIPAFAQMALPQAVLVLAGPDYDGYGEVVRRLVRENRIEERVVFTGMLEGRQRIEALVDADLFVLPSHHENFGIVVAEAMAAGAPVLVSREVNLWNEVVAACAGSAVSGDVAELAREMERWMGDRERRAAASRAGRAYALAHYDWNTIARHWADHYARLRRP